MVCGTYRLLEDSVQNQAGILAGTFASYFYLDSAGSVRYDDIGDVADDHCNNQFVGTWTAYSSHLIERCNWGDSRIPNSEQLDSGAGEFGPDERFAKNGWQNYIDAYISAGPKDQAVMMERAEWWK